MTADMASTRRTRAWILVKAERGAALQLAEAIWADFHEPDNAFVVRADVVSGPYDIVVAVDAENQEALTEQVVNGIQNLDGVRETLTLVIGKHHPWPPHVASGYVSEEEAAASNPLEAGPQRYNAWG